MNILLNYSLIEILALLANYIPAIRDINAQKGGE